MLKVGRRKIENKELSEKEFFDKHFSLSERRQAFREKRMYSVEIELVDQCQMSCAYCYNSPIRTKIPINENFLKELLQKLKSIGIKTVFWEGGEPLLYDALPDILQYTRDLGLKNNIISNGIGLTEKMCSAIGDLLDGFSYHIDTTDPEIFCKLQDANGKSSMVLHTKSIQGINNLIAWGYNPENIELNIVLTKHLEKDISKTIKWAVHEMHFGMVVILPLHPIGKASRGRIRKWLPDKKTIEEVFRFRAKIVRSELLKLGTMDLGKYYCMTNFYIDIYGNVYPCSFIPYYICGNIYTQDIREIIEQEYKWLSFYECANSKGHNRVLGPCGDCKNADMCFGCRANAYSYGEGIYSSDTLCWRVSTTEK